MVHWCPALCSSGWVHDWRCDLRGAAAWWCVCGGRGQFVCLRVNACTCALCTVLYDDAPRCVAIRCSPLAFPHTCVRLPVPACVCRTPPYSDVLAAVRRLLFAVQLPVRWPGGPEVGHGVGHRRMHGRVRGAASGCRGQGGCVTHRHVVFRQPPGHRGGGGCLGRRRWRNDGDGGGGRRRQFPCARVWRTRHRNSHWHRRRLRRRRCAA